MLPSRLIADHGAAEVAADVRLRAGEVVLDAVEIVVVEAERVGAP